MVGRRVNVIQVKGGVVTHFNRGGVPLQKRVMVLYSLSTNLGELKGVRE